jgi:hypothetical protein
MTKFLKERPRGVIKRQLLALAERCEVPPDSKDFFFTKCRRLGDFLNDGER